MTKRLSIATAVLTAVAAMLALLLVAAMPAMAAGKGGKNDRAKEASSSDRDGDADSDSSTGYTEDNDSGDGNTPNNVSDDRDNRHPSGKDRSVENGSSGNQGKSESTPDQDGHGPERDYNGTDKPNGPGGIDVADQDGNNGCGNDDDFEDDNEGWCGKPPAEDEEVGGEVIVEVPTCEEIMGSKEACEPEVPEVDGTVEESTDTPEVLGELIHGDDEVAAEAVDADTVAAAPAERAAGRVLPFTGGAVLLYIGLALGLIGSGLLFWRKERA